MEEGRLIATAISHAKTWANNHGLLSEEFPKKSKPKK
jgi:hypothetical protein